MLRFEQKLMDNFSIIVRDPHPLFRTVAGTLTGHFLDCVFCAVISQNPLICHPLKNGQINLEQSKKMSARGFSCLDIF
jgi:hypothetical protein